MFLHELLNETFKKPHSKWFNVKIQQEPFSIGKMFHSISMPINGIVINYLVLTIVLKFESQLPLSLLDSSVIFSSLHLMIHKCNLDIVEFASTLR